MESDDNRSNPAERVPEVVVDERFLPQRFLVVSNRLPYQVTIEDDQVKLTRGVGGLVTALDPVLRLTGGSWIGWTGGYQPVPGEISVDDQFSRRRSYDLRTLDLNEEEVSRFYLGHANRCVWPLFHFFQEYAEFDEDNWETYREVNRKFARKVIEEHRNGDFVWIHDYHLMLVPRMVREAIPQANIGFFLHIPFPAPEIFQIDVHAEDVLEGLLGADLVGFQTAGDAKNFIGAVADLTEHRCSVVDRWVRADRRTVRVGTLPISIDCEQFESMASRPGIEKEIEKIRRQYVAKFIAVGVDRLDYTKGILERLRGIETMFDLYPELRGNFTFVQLSAPSRTKVHTYQTLRTQIEQMVGRINGRFGGHGCLPVDYRYEGYPQDRLVAYYRAADVALVTPLRDGMNLVAKEYVVSQQDQDGGSLVLSRFAGASHELNGAIRVNPYHPRNTAEGIHRGLTMDPDEKRERMRRMRLIVKRNDIYWWLEQFLRQQSEAVHDR